MFYIETNHFPIIGTPKDLINCKLYNNNRILSIEENKVLVNELTSNKVKKIYIYNDYILRCNRDANSKPVLIDGDIVLLIKNDNVESINSYTKDSNKLCG